MTNQLVYDTALRLVSEIGDAGQDTDYAERSCYLLPVVFQQLAPYDRIYRETQAETQADTRAEAASTVSLANICPLSEIFLSAAANLLASLLVISENPSLSARMEQLSRDALKVVLAEIPCRLEAIQNRYPYL